MASTHGCALVASTYRPSTCLPTTVTCTVAHINASRVSVRSLRMDRTYLLADASTPIGSDQFLEVQDETC